MIISYVKSLENRKYESKKKEFSKAVSKQIVYIETGEVYPSATFVEKNLINGVRDVIYGKQLTAGGYHWKYLNEEPKKKIPFQRKMVICVNIGEIFDNADKAAEFIWVNSYLIRSVCNGNKKCNIKGLTFYYYNGEYEKELNIRGSFVDACVDYGRKFVLGERR